MSLVHTPDCDDWSAAEHRAAAAALGSYAARMLKMGYACVDPGDRFGRGMASESALQARWLAVDAARHAHAAEKLDRFCGHPDEPAADPAVYMRLRADGPYAERDKLEPLDPRD